MKKLRFLLCVGTLMAAVGIIAPAAMAEATRTWVSGVGDDANPCSRTAPCKTFAGAISKTAAKGEINVIDSGGFGGVTITKALTINGLPFEAGVLVSGTNAINVNAAAGDKVVLRGLDIEGLGTSPVGIRYLSGQSLVVDRVQIHDFTGNAIGVPWTSATGATGRLYVRRSDIDSNGNGIVIGPASGFVRGSVIDTSIDDNGTGLITSNNRSSLSVLSSEISGNSVAGAFAQGGFLNLVGSLVAANNTGLLSAAGGLMRVSSSTITANDTGVSPSGGTIASRGDNTLEGNGADGAFNGTFTGH